MRVLRKGTTGPEVEAWQKFLAEEGFLVGKVDGDFGPKTEAATKAFQKRYLLVPDGIVGMQTYTTAFQYGYDPLEWTDPAGQENQRDPYWPPVPANLKALTESQAFNTYGKFEWRRDTQAADKRCIKILGDWTARNLVTATIPQLARLPKPRNPQITLHRLAVTPTQNLFAAWESAGLLPLIKTWDGAYNPRTIGMSNTVSNHAFAAAFDINAAFNPWGGNVPLVGQPGSVRLLVPLANQHGFFWGGHYRGKKDGMHFELARP